MQQERYNPEHYVTLYSGNTDPFLTQATAPIPANQFPRPSWLARFWYGVGNIFVAIIRKINQLLATTLTAVLLLLLMRATLTFFSLTTSLFSQWVYMLSAPLIIPFNNMLPVVPYGEFHIEASTLFAMAVYLVAGIIIHRFLKLLITRPN
jgi:hypothetical protein